MSYNLSPLYLEVNTPRRYMTVAEVMAELSKANPEDRVTYLDWGHPDVTQVTYYPPTKTADGYDVPGSVLMGAKE